MVVPESLPIWSALVIMTLGASRDYLLQFQFHLPRFLGKDTFGSSMVGRVFSSLRSDFCSDASLHFVESLPLQSGELGVFPFSKKSEMDVFVFLPYFDDFVCCFFGCSTLYVC